MAPYQNKFASVVQNCTFLVLFETHFHYICTKFSIIILKIATETAPSKDAIWENVFSEQYQQQSIEKIQCFFGANNVQI